MAKTEPDGEPPWAKPTYKEPGSWQVEDDTLIYVADHWPHVDEPEHPE